MKGYIHSTESFGTVDGPGIRYVVFMQGCPMRCLYCHNPDTWEMNKGNIMTTDDILKEYQTYLPYMKNGGITVSGGEPLMQMDFVIELFEKATGQGIHTCIDTSGLTFSDSNPVQLAKFDQLLKVTDLVLLDIKHIDSNAHFDLTGQHNEQILKFASYLDEKGVPVWIRHVVVPTITDKEESLLALGYFLGGLSNIKALDILPYHDMGKIKYEQMGMEYPLEHIEPLSNKQAAQSRNIVIEGMKKRLRELKSV